MKLRSASFTAGQPIPDEFAYGAPGTDRPVVDGGNRNPHLAWSDVPDATRSFALLCVDSDMPARFDEANQPGRTIARDFPRRDFVHWVMVDVPGVALDAGFGAGDVLRAVAGHVLAEAALVGTYTLNPALRAASR